MIHDYNRSCLLELRGLNTLGSMSDLVHNKVAGTGKSSNCMM